MEALLRTHRELTRAVAPAKLKVVVLGVCEPALAGLVRQVQDSAPGLLEHGNIPHASVPSLLASSSLFLPYANFWYLNRFVFDVPAAELAQADRFEFIAKPEEVRSI